MAISNNNTGIRTGVCTSTTRPTAPYEGQHIYETDTDFEFVWNGSAWVRIYTASTTTKGDLQTFSTVPTRLAVGTDGYALRANSSAATGLEWALNPYAVSAGALYGGAVSTTVTFPSGRFNATPVLIPQNLGTTWTALVSALSTSSFTYSNSVGGNDTMHWIAIQMTPTTAIG
jgi:hypothetical protein